MANANVRLLEPQVVSQHDPYAPLTNEEWIHERVGVSPRVLPARTRLRTQLARGYVFEPKALQEVAQVGQGAFEKSGRSYDALFTAVHQELLRRYPGKIAKDLRFTMNIAGGARGRYALFYGGLQEYLLMFNVPLRTQGFSGRYKMDLWDFVMAGSLNYFDNEHAVPVRKPAGTYTYLRRGTATVYEGLEGTVALEYGRGFVPQCLDFGIIRAMAFETGDWRVGVDQLKRYTQLMFGFGR